MPLSFVMRGVTIAAATLAIACKRDAASSDVQPDPTPASSAPTTKSHAGLALSVPAPAGSGIDAPDGWARLVEVAADGTIRFAFVATKMRLKKDRVVDDTGAEVIACRGGSVVVEGVVTARLLADGFEDALKRVTIAPGGMATLDFHAGDERTIRFDGVDDGDTCTAALLYYVIPAPSML